MFHHILQTRNGLKIQDRGAQALRVVGVFFAMMGGLVIAVVMGLIPAESHPVLFSGEWISVFAIGAIFFAVGGGAFLYTNYFEFDFRRQEGLKVKGFGRKDVERVSLPDFKEIVVSRERDTNGDSYNDYLYPVFLRGEGQSDVVIGKYSDVSNALAVAQVVESHTGLKAIDSVLGEGKEFSFTSSDKAGGFDIVDVNRSYMRDIPFAGDGNYNSFSRLYRGRHQGGTFYKVEYSDSFIPNVIGICFAWGIYYWLFRDSLYKGVVEFVANGGHIEFEGMSAEQFFGTFFPVLFFIFLVVLPVIGLIKKIALPRPFELIGVGAKNLLLYSPMAYLEWDVKGLRKRKALIVGYNDIHDLKIKAVENPKWKFMKLENGIGLRVGDKFVEIGKGLDEIQLIQIADEIKAHMKR